MASKRMDVENLATELAQEAEQEIKTSILDRKYKDFELLQLPIEAITANPEQPRKEFNEITIRELAQSIENDGLIQPLVVRPVADNKFELIAGERRLRALKWLGRAKAPVIIRNTQDPLELALIENIQREDLNPVDLAEALHKLKILHGMSDEAVGKIIGKSQSWVTETLSVTKLSPELKQKAKENDISRSALIEIARGKLSLDNVINGQSKPTVRELRAQRKGQEPPKRFKYSYRSENKQFTIHLIFDKAKASKEEIKAAFKEAAQSVK